MPDPESCLWACRIGGICLHGRIVFVGAAEPPPDPDHGAEELAFLNEIRCNTAQGFYFGKPMRLAELHAAIMADAMLPQESYASCW